MKSWLSGYLGELVGDKLNVYVIPRAPVAQPG